MLSSFPPASAFVVKASVQPDYLPAGIRGLRSAGDADGEPHGEAALDQLRDLMPADVVGVNLGERLPAPAPR
jgi:hypothetical protein